MDLENREKEGEKDYEDKKTYCCGFNGTYATGTYARNCLLYTSPSPRDCR